MQVSLICKHPVYFHIKINIATGEAKIDELAQLTSFDNMKQMNLERAKNPDMKKANDLFFRKGKVGAFAEQFESEEKLNEWNDYVEKKLKESNLDMPFQ